MTFRPYRRRTGSPLTPTQRGFAWGFGLAAVFWIAVGVGLYFLFR